MSQGFFNQEAIEIPCSACGKKTKQSIGWLKRHKEFVCSCGTVIGLNTDQFRRALQEAEKSLADFERKIADLNKLF